MVHKTCSFSRNGEFVHDTTRKHPTYFACVFWSDLQYNLFDIYCKLDIFDIHWTSYGLNKLISSKNMVHKTNSFFFQTAPHTIRRIKHKKHGKVKLSGSPSWISVYFVAFLIVITLVERKSLLLVW